MHLFDVAFLQHEAKLLSCSLLICSVWHIVFIITTFRTSIIHICILSITLSLISIIAYCIGIKNGLSHSPRLLGDTVRDYVINKGISAPTFLLGLGSSSSLPLSSSVQ